MMKPTKHGPADRRRLAGIAVCSLGLLAGGPGYAAEVAETPAPVSPVTAEDVADSKQRDIGEIIVRARKREESVLKVPVVLTAIPATKLDALQATEMADLPRLAPGLSVGHSLLSIGSIVAIRGVGTTVQDPGVDQSISLNIDGLSLSQGLAFSSGMFDVGQIEVLKGPQALFFGKGSPGGVIALRSADPTDEVEVMVRGGYEFEADEERGELIVSGPLTDTLKARFAGMFSNADGYFRNNSVAPDPLIYGTTFGARTPNDRDEPRPESDMVRLTLLWEPSDRFNARLKYNLVSDYSEGNPEAAQLSNCPDGAEQSFGIPFIGGDNCDMDDDLHNIYYDTAFYPGDASLPPLSNDGVPYLAVRQHFGTLELNYDLTPELTLTSVTGAYRLSSHSMVNTFHTTSAPPSLAVENNFTRREIHQELRLTSDYSGPLNFMLGGYYQDGRMYDRVTFRANTVMFPAQFWPFVNRDASSTVDIETNSLFGQLRYNLRPDLELAVGARWSDEMRRLAMYNYHLTLLPAATAPFFTPVLPGSFETGDPKTHSSNVAHETTLTYTPTEDLTLFAAYKRGYKSGSFAIAVPSNPGEDKAFGDEKVDGFEVGLKSRLFDRQVLFNIAAYKYDYDGLQVGGIEPTVSGGIPVINVLNAGGAETYGIEFDVAYSPARIEGLRLNAGVNWNHGRYETLNNVPCANGQTVDQGCNRIFTPDDNQTAPGDPGAVLVDGQYGYYYAQDLSGTRMVQAPDWMGNFGFDYTFPVGSRLEMVVASNTQYSSKVPTFLAVGRPDEDNYQRRFMKSDLSLTLKDIDDRWEVALIGKNIGDTITSTFCSATNFAGGGLLGAPITGGTISGPAGWAEASCYTDRGRSVWLRFTWRPSFE